MVVSKRRSPWSGGQHMASWTGSRLLLIVCTTLVNDIFLPKILIEPDQAGFGWLFDTMASTVWKE
jgi:hypothetical protein